MNLYSFKPTEKDGVAPDGALIYADSVVFHLWTYDDHNFIHSTGMANLKPGQLVLCSISIDDLDEVKQMKERIAYLEQIIRGLGYGELL